MSNLNDMKGNEYYQEQWKRFRKSYNIKNKYLPIGQDHYFGDFKYEATQWNEEMLTKVHQTIRLEGRPKPITPSGQQPTGNRRRSMKVTKVQSDSGSK